MKNKNENRNKNKTIYLVCVNKTMQCHIDMSPAHMYLNTIIILKRTHYVKFITIYCVNQSSPI